MSLVKCPECGKEISDQSKQCIYCGYPIEKKIKEESLNKPLVYDKTMECPICHETKWEEIRQEGDIVCSVCGYIHAVDSARYSEYLKVYRTIPKTNQIQCPYCSSTNIKKISGTSRLASAVTFGILSKKIGKQWHCNNCKSDF